MSDFLRLESSIFETLSWFDIFNFPLTFLELNQYLYGYDDIEDVSEIKQVLDKSLKFRNHQGFYFLSSRDNSIVINRLRQYNFFETKFKKRLWVFKIIARLPFVRLLGLCNTMAYRGASKDSDIDIFIITQKNRLWIVRCLVLLFLTIFFLRPHKNKTKDKICLSFMIDSSDLNLEKFKQGDDIYFHFWIAHLMPIYNQEIYQDFWQSNSWIKQKLKCILPQKLNPYYKIEHGKFGESFKPATEKVIDFLGGNFLEKKIKQIQVNKLPSSIYDKMNIGSQVVINDHVFKAHTSDRRKKYQEIFESKIIKNV